MSSDLRQPERQSSGFTIVEIVVTIVILGIALISVAAMVRLGTQSSADVMLQTRVIALGQSYLDEIMGRRFDENSAASGLDPCFGLAPGPARPCTAIAALGPDGASESSRETFDDVDDYNGWEEGDGTGDPILDAEGDVRADYENFHVAIAVRYAGNDVEWAWPGPVPAPDPTHAKLITVTVTIRGQDEGWIFSAYKGNY